MNKKIVVIDDDSVIVQGILTAFELVGYTTECMTTGKRSKEEIIAARPDIIFLDISLDGMSGIDISKSLKQDARTARIPIVLISASPTIQEDTAASGADDYIKKPFSVTDILNKANYYLFTKQRRSKRIATVGKTTSSAAH